MTDLDARSFSIDASLALPTDGYEAQLASSALVRSSTLPETVTLRAGLQDRATGTVYSVGQLEGGIDKLVFRKDGRSLTASIRGTDRLALLLERRVRKLYLRQQPPTGHTPTIPYAVGLFTAQEVARELVEAAGLSLSWECRDYRLLVDFEATGRAIDVLRTLVEPWSQVEALRVDIFAQGETVVCRPRALTLVPDHTETITGARISDFTVEVSRGPVYGTVTLYGRQVPRYSYGVQQSQEEEETPTPEAPPPEPGQPIEPWELTLTACPESRDEAGPTSRVITETTYRMPDKLVTRIHEHTLQRDGDGAASPMVAVSEREIVNEWEESVYSDQGRTNTPRQLRQIINLYGVHKHDEEQTWRQLAQEVTTFGRDAEEYRELTTTVKWDLDLTLGYLVPAEKVVKTLRDVEHMKVEQLTTIYKPRASTMLTGYEQHTDWYVATTDRQEQMGLRPDGPPPPPPPVCVPRREEDEEEGIEAGAQGVLEAIRVEDTLSEDPTAVDVSYSSPHLTEEDLRFILAQYQAISGLWRYTIRLTGVAMPWLRKGNVLHLTGLLAEDGVAEIPLQPALITEAQLSYSESGSPPAFLRTMTLEYWGALWPA